MAYKELTTEEIYCCLNQAKKDAMRFESLHLYDEANHCYDLVKFFERALREREVINNGID